MQGLYLMILCSIKETNLDEKKTEFQDNHSQQTSDELACRDLDQFIAGAKVFNVASLLMDYKKGACL